MKLPRLAGILLGFWAGVAMIYLVNRYVWGLETRVVETIWLLLTTGIIVYLVYWGDFYLKHRHRGGIIADIVKQYNSGKMPDNPRTLERLDRYIEYNPASLQAWAMRAQFHYKRQDLARAIEDFQEALKLAPQHPGLLHNLSACYSLAGQTPAAIELCSHALDQNPDNIKLISMRGFLYTSRGNFLKAFTDLSQCHEAGYWDDLTMMRLGVIAIHRGDPDLAVHYYNEALSAGDNEINKATVLGLRGEVHYQNGRIKQAREDFDQALGIRPDDVYALVERGMHFNIFDDLQAALEISDAHLKKNPDDVIMNVNRGYIYYRLAMWDQALPLMERALTLDPDSYHACRNLAALLVSMPDQGPEEVVRALELAEKARDITEGEDIFNLRILAAVYAEAGKFDEAIKQQEDVIVRWKGNPVCPFMGKAREYLSLHRERKTAPKPL